MILDFISNFIIWLGTFTVFYLINSIFAVKQKKNYIKNWIFFSLMYSIFVIILFSIFHNRYLEFTNYLEWYQLITLVSYFCFIALIYRYWQKKYKTRIKILYSANPNIEKLAISYKYFLPKSIEIAAQQLMFILLLSFFNEFENHSFSYLGIPLIIGLLHLLAAQYLHKYYVYYVSGICVIVGFFVIWIYQNIANGFIYTYIAHWLYSIITPYLIIKNEKIVKIEK